MAFQVSCPVPLGVLWLFIAYHAERIARFAASFDARKPAVRRGPWRTQSTFDVVEYRVLTLQRRCHVVTGAYQVRPQQAQLSQRAGVRFRNTLCHGCLAAENRHRPEAVGTT